MTHLDCDDVGSQLEAWRDGLVDIAEASLIEQHLADCPRCAEELQFSYELSSGELYPEYDLDAAEIARSGRWRDETSAPSPPLLFLPRRARLFAAIAAAALLSLGLALYYSWTPPPVPASGVMGEDSSSGSSDSGSSSATDPPGQAPIGFRAEGQGQVNLKSKAEDDDSSGTSGSSGDDSSGTSGSSGSSDGQ